MQKYIPLLGKLGLIFGLITAITAFLPGWGIFVSMFCMIPGFLLSSLYVMQSLRYQMEMPKFNPGYLGMLFSTTPFILFVVFYISS